MCELFAVRFRNCRFTLFLRTPVSFKALARCVPPGTNIWNLV